MTSSHAPDETYNPETEASEAREAAQAVHGRVERLSVERIDRRPRLVQGTGQAQTHPPQPHQAPRPMRAEGFSSDDRELQQESLSPMDQIRRDLAQERAAPTAPVAQAPQAKPPRPRLDPKNLRPEEELARQAAILGTLEAASAILSARLLLFVAVAIAAVLAFQVHDLFSAGVFGAWIGVVMPIVALIDWISRRRPT